MVEVGEFIEIPVWPKVEGCLEASLLLKVGTLSGISVVLEFEGYVEILMKM